jgi:thioredoxin reductase (NADPH)
MEEKIRDVIIIGAGPSALAAAVYTTREDVDTVLYEKGAIGGLAAVTDLVDNYPGFPDGIEGLTLASQLEKQAGRFGAQIEFGDVTAVRVDGAIKIVTVDGVEVKAHSVLIATGSDYSKLGIPGEMEYYGRGVHYCATCDGALYRDKKLVVVGGGNSAVQEAMFLTRFATHIDLLVRSTIKASEILIHDLQKFIDNGKITVHLGTTTDEIVAVDSRVTTVKATHEGQPVTFEADGVFVFVGLKPNTDFLKDSGVELDERRLVKTDLHLQTNIPGIYASGDVRSGATMQIASAVGEGATAALSIREYVDELKK